MNGWHVWFWQSFGSLIGVIILLAPLAFLLAHWMRADRDRIAAHQGDGEGRPYAWPDATEKAKRWALGTGAVAIGLLLAVVIVPGYAFDDF